MRRSNDTSSGAEAAHTPRAPPWWFSAFPASLDTAWEVGYTSQPGLVLNSSTPTVFLSYRRKDAAVHAGWLHDEMTARFGPGHVFIDVDLEPAVNFVQRITEVLGACSVMVVMIGPSWATIAGDQGQPRLFDDRDFVRFEVETALRRDDVRVIPVLVAGAKMPDPAQLPESLRTLPDLNGIDLSDDLRRRRDDVTQLLIAVEGGSTEQDQTPPFWLPLLKGLLVTAAAGVAGGLLGERSTSRGPTTSPGSFRM